MRSSCGSARETWNLGRLPHQRLDNIRASKMNDLWIAALCLQHTLPLLTNDRGFDSIEGLRVIHW